MSKSNQSDGSRSRWPETSAIAAIVLLASVALPQSIRADDDWHVIERHTSNAPAETREVPAAKAGARTEACGEAARPAKEPYKSIVAQLDDMWGTNFPVYESTEAVSPHARSGGCIFYNREYLNNLMEKWMKIDDQDAIRPMLYAIFAHEIGHLAHADFDPGQDNVPVRNKELAADQFAGYSLARLGIRRLDPVEVTRYYQMTGDDFVGHSSGHGSGIERTSAFQDGWHRAEVGLPEQGSRPAGGLGEP